MHTWFTSMAAGLAAALVLGWVTPASAAEDVGTQIALAAEADAAGYIAVRDLLIEQGEEALPGLRSVAEAGSWRESAAARACIGWIEQGDDYRAFGAAMPRPTASGLLRYGPPQLPRDADLVPLLVERMLWTEGDEELRTAAVDLLQRERDGRATAPLAWALRTDPSERVRQAASQALERSDDPAATRALRDALPTLESGALREAVAGALGWRKDATAVPALVALLAGDEDDGCRARAAQSLGWIGDERALSTLTTALGSDPAAGVRQHAALALGRLGSDEARAALEQAVDTDADSEVVRLATHALGRL